MSFTAIDLSTLTAPDVVEQIDYKTILAAMVADLQARDSSFTALVESDPAWKILEVAAYREMLVRQRANDAARACMLAFATGNDLAQLGAIFGVTRKTITPADEEAVPPVAAVIESDSDFRYRITLALEGLSTAGPEGSYLYHTLKSESVKSARITGPPDMDPGEVLVTLLGATGNGSVASDVIDEVAAILNDEDVRPLTDHVTVQSATIIPYTVSATIYTFAGPDSAVVMAKATAALQAYVSSLHRIGFNVPLSGIYAALHVEGVQRVVLSEPLANIEVDFESAAYCTGIELTYGGVAE